MLGGMIDAINNWATDALGDSILNEDDNEYKVNLSLVEAKNDDNYKTP